MPISLPQGFSISSREVVDTRLVLTKEQMLAAAKGSMPAIYLCVCSDDNKIYIFDGSIPKADKDPEVGYFRPLENYLNFDTPEAKALLDSVMANIIKTGSETSKKAVETIVEDKITTVKIDGQLVQ